MKKVVILYEEINQAVLQENISILKGLWEEMGYAVTELMVQAKVSPDIYMNELVRLKESFLVTFAMAGFEWSGLTEQMRFNVLETMQIHILIGNLPYYDFYLQKEYGIHSFIVTDCRDIFANWKTKYPQIPFMDIIPTLYTAKDLTEDEKNANRTNYQAMLRRILAYIENPSPL